MIPSPSQPSRRVTMFGIKIRRFIEEMNRARRIENRLKNGSSFM